MYSIVLYCVLLYYSVLYCILLYSIVFYCILLYSTVFYCMLSFRCAVEKLDATPAPPQWAKSSEKRSGIFAFAGVFSALGWKRSSRAPPPAKRASMPLVITPSQKQRVAALATGRPAHQARSLFQTPPCRWSSPPARSDR